MRKARGGVKEIMPAADVRRWVIRALTLCEIGTLQLDGRFTMVYTPGKYRAAIRVLQTGLEELAAGRKLPKVTREKKKAKPKSPARPAKEKS